MIFYEWDYEYIVSFILCDWLNENHNGEYIELWGGYMFNCNWERERGGAVAVGKVANTTLVLLKCDFIIESGERRMKRRKIKEEKIW